MYDFSKIQNRSREVENWFRSEISLLRTGRASPALLENIKVDYYGAKALLKSMASISTKDARTLRVAPWDLESITQIEQAIRASELGVQPIVEKNLIRVVFPELTEERRNSLLKILAGKLEEAKISLRREREEVWRDIQDKEQRGELSEDDKYRYKDELQKIIEKSMKTLEETAAKKKEEIRG
jgi:ribosome recycling factor